MSAMQVNDPYEAQNRKNLSWLATGLILLAAVSLLGFTTGWLQVLGRQPAMVTQVHGNGTQLPILDEGSDTPLVVTDEGEPASSMTLDQAKQMPKDIFDWLKHLERIERERRRMSTAQAAELSVAMTKMSLGGATDMLKSMLGGEGGEDEDPPLPTEGLVSSTEEKRKEWTKLVEDFRSYPPPTECAAAAASYDEALTETQAMMMEVLEAVNVAQESPDKAVAILTEMQGKSSERIDVAGRDTDVEVQRICDKYETRKWFGISSDFAGGLGGKIPSLPGM
jgi:predicted RNase H-like HicB family nuclease